jgi:hypothetical protein
MRFVKYNPKVRASLAHEKIETHLGHVYENVFSMNPPWSRHLILKVHALVDTCL